MENTGGCLHAGDGDGALGWESVAGRTQSPSTLSQPQSREAAREKESCQHIVRGAFDHF